MQLQFVECETTFNYFAAVRAYVPLHGKARAFSSDKFSVFRVNIPDALSGTGLTQFGRAMKGLDIELLCAHSPQAKGRVERANRTLQDRPVKELRRRGICSITEANAYRPEFIAQFNARFSVSPRSREDAHRPPAATAHLDRILVQCERRPLSKSLTISYNNVIYQVSTRRAAYTMRGAHVEVRETSGGEVSIESKGKALAPSVFSERERRQARVTPSKLVDAALSRPARTEKRKTYHPPMSHPWKYFDYSEKSMEAMGKRGDICILRK